jgi:hypothetical protein
MSLEYARKLNEELGKPVRKEVTRHVKEIKTVEQRLFAAAGAGNARKFNI